MEGMTDPTPAEALKAEDIAARALFDFDVATERRIGRERNRKWETELPEYRDHMRAKASAMLAALPSPATDAGEARAWRDGVEAAAKVCAEWSTMLSMRVDDLIRIRAPQRTVKAIREAANQVLNVEAAIRKLP